MDIDLPVASVDVDVTVIAPGADDKNRQSTPIWLKTEKPLALGPTFQVPAAESEVVIVFVDAAVFQPMECETTINELAGGLKEEVVTVVPVVLVALRKLPGVEASIAIAIYLRLPTATA
jgi:hypothetical protein